MGLLDKIGGVTMEGQSLYVSVCVHYLYMWSISIGSRCRRHRNVNPDKASESIYTYSDI